MNKEIVWNIVNSLLAGVLVFLGALTDDGINARSMGVALIASLIVAIVQFKNYWQKEEEEYSDKPKTLKTLGTFLSL